MTRGTHEGWNAHAEVERRAATELEAIWFRFIFVIVAVDVVADVVVIVSLS